MKTAKWAVSILLVAISTGGFFSCKKVKEDIAMSFLIKAMTDGRWLVNIYTKDNVDETSAFDGYEFQFTADGKVYAINGSTQTEGTWVGDVNARTIYSNFPGASEPLMKLNDTFLITNNTTKLVEAKPLDQSENVYLKLVKKS